MLNVLKTFYIQNKTIIVTTYNVYINSFSRCFFPNQLTNKRAFNILSKKNIDFFNYKCKIIYKKLFLKWVTWIKKQPIRAQNKWKILQ